MEQVFREIALSCGFYFTSFEDFQTQGGPVAKKTTEEIVKKF